MVTRSAIGSPALNDFLVGARDSVIPSRPGSECLWVAPVKHTSRDKLVTSNAEARSRVMATC